jgi:hypothetical protein
MDNAFQYAMIYSMMTSANYPYKAIDQDCQYSGAKVTQVKPTGFTDVT